MQGLPFSRNHVREVLRRCLFEQERRFLFRESSETTFIRDTAFRKRQYFAEPPNVVPPDFFEPVFHPGDSRMRYPRNFP